MNCWSLTSSVQSECPELHRCSCRSAHQNAPPWQCHSCQQQPRPPSPPRVHGGCPVAQCWAERGQRTIRVTNLGLWPVKEKLFVHNTVLQLNGLSTTNFSRHGALHWSELKYGLINNTPGKWFFFFFFYTGELKPSNVWIINLFNPVFTKSQQRRFSL